MEKGMRGHIRHTIWLVWGAMQGTSAAAFISQHSVQTNRAAHLDGTMRLIHYGRVTDTLVVIR